MSVARIWVSWAFNHSAVCQKIGSVKRQGIGEIDSENITSTLFVSDLHSLNSVSFLETDILLAVVDNTLENQCGGVAKGALE